MKKPVAPTKPLASFGLSSSINTWASTTGYGGRDKTMSLVGSPPPPQKNEFHASKNKRVMLTKIDNENAKLYKQLSMQ